MGINQVNVTYHVLKISEDIYIASSTRLISAIVVPELESFIPSSSTNAKNP